MLIYVTFVIGSLKAFGILTNHCIIGFLYAKHALYGYCVCIITHLGIFFYVNSIGIPLSIKFFLLMIMNKCVEFALLLFHNAISAES